MVKKNKNPDIEIKTIKGFFLVCFIILVLFFFIFILPNYLIYKSFKNDVGFYQNIEKSGLGEGCNSYSIWNMEECSYSTGINEENKTQICNLAYKYNRKRIIRRHCLD